VIEEEPVLIVTFTAQQVHCIKNRFGKAIEGAEVGGGGGLLTAQDDIRNYYYVWAFQQDADDLAWKVSEIHIRDTQKTF
jgi:hypothetical protein